MLAQSTLLPLASAPAGAWAPVHRHITLDGVVPLHTHSYELPASEPATAGGCMVTGAASSESASAHDESIVCAPDDGSATTSVTAAAQHEPAGVALRAPGINALVGVPSESGWRSIVTAALTPPPRA
jgi:hypothetical protein